MQNTCKSGVLSLTSYYGDGVDIGDVRIKFEKYGDNQVRVYIQAPKEFRIERFKVPPGENAFDRKATLSARRDKV